MNAALRTKGNVTDVVYHISPGLARTIPNQNLLTVFMVSSDCFTPVSRTPDCEVSSGITE